RPVGPLPGVAGIPLSGGDPGREPGIEVQQIQFLHLHHACTAVASRTLGLCRLAPGRCTARRVLAGGPGRRRGRPDGRVRTGDEDGAGAVLLG
nr:hypothetical protein [Tanacetum cinerariifolium]